MMMVDVVSLQFLLRAWLDENPNRWDMPIRDAYWSIHKAATDALEGAKDEG